MTAMLLSAKQAESVENPKPKVVTTRKSGAKQNKQTGSATSTVALAGQGYLPGLSRRGRPRLDTPISAVERTAEHRRKRIEAGAKRVEMILDPEAARALDALAQHFKEPRSDVVATLILKAAHRLFKP